MRAVVQRVKNASVTVDAVAIGIIETGLLVLIGIEDSDDLEDIKWLSSKLVNMRIFDDQFKIPNLSVKDINGNILLISQFTLFASTKKGNRPGYTRAARPEIAIPLYKELISQLSSDLGKQVETGEFGADMQVSLINDGHVTIIIDSKNKDL